jgi:hypothetical protein
VETPAVKRRRSFCFVLWASTPTGTGRIELAYVICFKIKNKKNMRLLLIAFSLLLITCSSNKNTTSTDTLTLAFGNGGGFTGIETKYIVESTGKVLKIFGRDTTVLKNIDIKELKTIYSDANLLKDYKYFKPDNMYQFIEINNNRIVWGFNTESVNPKAINLYQQLTTLLK